ncbi:MAG: alanine--tRNA ligase [SAR324 cluster bacterium]|nr:alanine--tRNA ligase [SAR324 cluster bacterium]MBL7035136.1 alanine--tRNA ligase [SAR324 cluster bacterium]
MKSSKQIRQEFITFFEDRGHSFVRSAPVVPNDDPTLLFSNSGMAQFKDVFLGTGVREYKRAVNSQKCIRASGKHNDLEDVGHDNYHHTFFEMLGNWSFGDYFKQEAIVWAWELMTEVWGLPKDKLWATVFEGGDGVEADEDAEKLWRTCTDINPEQVLRFDKNDNFWEMGEVGPCGPCSELHIDLGEGTCPLAEKHECAVNLEGCWRFVELWNLVFMQYQRFPDGHLEELAAQHVDTGMGLERVCRVLQKVDSNYSTDLFTPILNKISEVTGLPDADGDVGVAFRVIADHLRSLSFAIADGAFPSNEGRGYVLRRMLRRATRYGRVLKMHEPFIYKLVPILAEVMGDAFPEIQKQQKHVQNVIQSEEKSFGLTLDRGLEIFENMISAPETQAAKLLAGADVFKLYDTYGFPVDLTRLMSEERGFGVDESGFEKLMLEQQERARDAGKFKATLDEWTEVSAGSDSKFRGYNELNTDSKLRRYSRNEKGQWQFILDTTPFYAESGGQVGDHGTLKQNGITWQVVDVQKQGDSIIHICEAENASDNNVLPDASAMIAAVDEKLRLPTTNNHTAAHLMHEGLRQVLGEHVVQAGSLVNPEILRFDFTHFEKVNEQQLEEIENIVNSVIRENITTDIYEIPFQQAIDSGITALFGEKYGDRVRVVKVADFSEELCGGCHVKASGQIGQFRIVSEEAIASGVRRIVAVTGRQAELINQEHGRVARSLRQLMNVPEAQVPEMVKKLAEEKRQLEKDLQTIRNENALAGISELLSEAENIEGVLVFAKVIEVESADLLRKMGQAIRQKMSSGVAWLAMKISSESDEKAKSTLLCVVTDDLISQGFSAGDLVNSVAQLADGRGGGKPDMAQAGIKAPEKLEDALSAAADIVREKLKK